MNTKESLSLKCNRIFNESVERYHVANSVDVEMQNPYESFEIEKYLYEKNHIDAVQWHLEDIIRKPDIDPAEALAIKRRIDKSNQERTDLVEMIDNFFLAKFKDVKPAADASINTETPAWAIDRLSILVLKIYHMNEETLRVDASPRHIESCRKKLETLLEQQKDLSDAIDALLDDIAHGKKYMKTYKQMKMYNDPSLNPELYGKNK